MRLTLVLAFTCAVTAAHAAGADCVDTRYLQGFDYKTPQMSVAKMDDSRQFEVAFQGTCGYTKFHPQLVFDATPAGRCLMPGNVLRSYDGGGCIVRRITEITPTH